MFFSESVLVVGLRSIGVVGVVAVGGAANKTKQGSTHACTDTNVQTNMHRHGHMHTRTHAHTHARVRVHTLERNRTLEGIQ